MIDKTTMRRIRAACGHALAGLLLLAVAVVPVLPAPARAADLVSNINVFNYAPWHSEYTATLVDVGVKRAQRFTTGSNATGYTLSSVVAYFMDIPALSVPRLSIYTVGADDYPDTLVHTLTAPATFTEEPTYGTFSTDALNTFTAPANAALAKDTDYFVVYENVGTTSSDPNGLH